MSDLSTIGYAVELADVKYIAGIAEILRRRP